jgi:hypothetical protein
MSVCVVIVEGLKQGKENVEKMEKLLLQAVSIHLSPVVLLFSTIL